MKKLITIIVFLSTSALMAQIAGSAHDFSSSTWNGTGQICITCHTPHNADQSVTNSPLWNHEVTTATFTPYTSGSLDSSPGQPGGISKLCLSCHDGTVGLGRFGGNTTDNNFITGNALLDTDLSDDHPISFTYDTALSTADGELKDPATATSGLGGVIATDMLFSGQMECASCHDVHNSTGLAFLLRVNNASSALCLTCHVK